MNAETATRTRVGLAEADLPGLGSWVSFWVGETKFTVVADEPDVWTLLRHRTSALSTITTFAETEAWYVALAADGSVLGNAAPSWRALVLRHV